MPLQTGANRRTVHFSRRVTWWNKFFSQVLKLFNNWHSWYRILLMIQVEWTENFLVGFVHSKIRVSWTILKTSTWKQEEKLQARILIPSFFFTFNHSVSCLIWSFLFLISKVHVWNEFFLVPEPASQHCVGFHFRAI